MTFVCGRSLAGGWKIPLTASLTLAMKSVSLFFFYNNWRNSDLTYIVKITHCPGPRLLFEKVNFNGRNQIGRPAHTFTQSLVNLTGFPSVEWLASNVYSKEKLTVSISSHEDVYIYQFQQGTICTATLLFQPQLITTMYIQLHMIKQHINSQFIVLHTCTHRHFKHDIVKNL